MSSNVIHVLCLLSQVPGDNPETERPPATETLVPPGKWWVAGVDTLFTLLVAFFKSSTHNFPFASFAFSHFASEVYPHPDFPRTLCFLCFAESTVNFKFCHCEAVENSSGQFSTFDPLRSTINHSSVHSSF